MKLSLKPLVLIASLLLTTSAFAEEAKPAEFRLPQVDWSDKTICRLLKSTQRREYHQVAVQRGLACAGSVKAIISAESSREDYEGHTILVASDVSKSAVDIEDKSG